LFELLLPAGMRVLSGELAEVDRLLDDRRLFAPFPQFFDPTAGRPSIPIETYLRLMFLKYRFGLGYERLCAEVADSISWRRFCRIGLEAPVPHESTIRKITRRCGPELVDALNRELLSAAAERGEVDLARVRADTTVVQADIKYPTDSGLLTAVTCRLASRLRRLRNAGVKISFTDRTSEARALQHSIAVWLRRPSDGGQSGRVRWSRPARRGGAWSRTGAPAAAARLGQPGLLASRNLSGSDRARWHPRWR
jgi:IS5 family transposase